MLLITGFVNAVAGLYRDYCYQLVTNVWVVREPLDIKLETGMVILRLYKKVKSS